MVSSTRKYVIELPVSWGVCVLIIVTFFPALTKSSCVQDSPGPGECANASNPYAADNSTVLPSSAIACNFSDLCFYRQGCRDKDMSDWYATDGIATANQTSPRCGALEAFSILESPWIHFSTVTCLSFGFRRLTPSDLDVFFEVRDSHVVTVVDRNQLHHHHTLNYSEQVTVYPLVGKIQFRAFGGGYGSPSYLELHPVSVANGTCPGQHGIVITDTPPSSSPTNSTTVPPTSTSPTTNAVPATATAAATGATVSTTTAATASSATTATATTAATAATTITATASTQTPGSNLSSTLATSNGIVTQSGSTLPSRSQQSSTRHVTGGAISGTTSSPSSSSAAHPMSSRLSAGCGEQSKKEEEDKDLSFGIGVIIGIVIGTILTLLSVIAGVLMFRKCAAKGQIHPDSYVSDTAPLDTSRRESARPITSTGFRLAL